MAKRASFFYAPTWDFPPGGPIKLGNVIPSVKKPERPLYSSLSLLDPSIFGSEKRSVRCTKEQLQSGKLSALTKFFSVLGLGVDVSTDIENGNEEAFAIDTLETTQFVPTRGYLQQCIESRDVRSYLERSRYRKPIYVITGVKTAKGARGSILEHRTAGVEVDSTVWAGGAIPIDVGRQVQGRIGNAREATCDGSSDFVIAFRVSKVFVGKAASQESTDEDYGQGAMLGVEAGQFQRPDLCILKVRDADANAEDFDTEELREGEDLVVCAIPRETESYGD